MKIRLSLILNNGRILLSVEESLIGIRPLLSNLQKTVNRASSRLFCWMMKNQGLVIEEILVATNQKIYSEEIKL